MCLVASTNCLHTDQNWLGIDTFSTYCMTNNKDDFTSTPTRIHANVTGVSGESTATISLHGPGTFFVMDELGAVCPLQIPDLYYCATVPYRLLSPQHLDKVWRAQGLGTMRSSTEHAGTTLYWTDNTGKEHAKHIQHTSKSGLPLCYTAPNYREYNDFLRSYQDTDDNNLCACAAVVEDTLQNKMDYVETVNLTAEINSQNNKEPIIADFANIDTQQIPEQDDIINIDTKTEKLLCHYKLGHLPFATINRMSQNGLLPKRFSKTVDPKCAACNYGQATKRPWRTKANPHSINDMRAITKPGECVSVDQMVSPVPGLIVQTKGHPTKARYNAATIFVDHYSDLTYCHLQPTLDAPDTIQAKEAFERYCNSNGVQVRHYHADNGRFAENEFMAHIATKGQTISFCGVNAHFQNGKAERRIRTLQDLARTQLLHAMRKWPVAITTHLWPYAITNVTNVLNDTPKKDQEHSRIEMFANTKTRPNINQHHHIGVPAYVLENELQAGKKIPKWLPRARVGIYLGKSPRHARNVSLILNPRTGMTSAQYHIKFDDTFETVKDLRETSHGWWLQKCGFTNSTQQPKLPNDFTTVETVVNKDKNKIVEPNETTIDQTEMQFTIDPFEMENQQDNAPNLPEDETTIHEGDALPDTPQQPTRRSTRSWKPTERILESIAQQDMALPVCLQAMVYDDEYETIIDNVNPMTLMAQTDADTMYWDQALKQPDADKFIEAAIDEVSTHQRNGHWKIILRDKVPTGVKVLDSVWSMKRKRRVKTNQVYKHKARLNVHGGQQEMGVNYWETYAPVVTWAAIRMVLILVILNNWHTVQIDFVLAYPQAEVECDIFMQIPKGFEIEGKTRLTHVIQLIKNLYGQKQAGRVWNQHLHNKLIELGWEQSKADECLYYHGDVLFIVYVDDGILVSPHKEHIDQQLKLLQQQFNISIEGTLQDYVGINIEKLDDNTINMTQPNIINSILHELNFVENTKPSSTPAKGGTIVTDGKENEPHKADWHYRRIIGKLNFLASSCRPELSCIVHQCARFSADPRENHTEAIKSIARYLKGTIDKGITMTPTESKFKVYVDADFGGLWDKDLAQDHPITSKSRTGYVVTYADCPIIWASQLQSEIAMSTTEAEYLALSMSLRATIPIMRLVKELSQKIQSAIGNKANNILHRL